MQSFQSCQTSADQRSFASSDLGGMGSKVSSSSAQAPSYSGLMVSGATMEIHYLQPGPTSVKEWEAYQVDLHKHLLDTGHNYGFDRLADITSATPLALRVVHISRLAFRMDSTDSRATHSTFTPQRLGTPCHSSCNDASLWGHCFQLQVRPLHRLQKQP